jgi:hypothetical protein
MPTHSKNELLLVCPICVGQLKIKFKEFKITNLQFLPFGLLKCEDEVRMNHLSKVKRAWFVH